MNEYTLNQAVSIAQSQVALEGDRLDKLVAYGKGFVQDTLNKVTGTLSGFSGSSYAHSTPASKNLINWANSESYVALGDVLVPAPIGIKVGFLEYITVLDTAVQTLSTLDQDLLKPLDALLGVYINDTSALDVRSPVRLDSRLASVRPDQLRDSITACFDKASKVAEAPYKQMFTRNADIMTTSTRMIQLQEACVKLDPKTIANRTAAIFNKAKIIADALGDDTSSNTKNNAARLSAYLHDAADWIETLSIVLYQVVELSTSVDGTVKKIKKMSR